MYEFVIGISEDDGSFKAAGKVKCKLSRNNQHYLLMGYCEGRPFSYDDYNERRHEHLPDFVFN